ncbi:MAG: cytochrome c oxidase subunit 3 [Pseudomonadota bacterium]
MRQAAAHVPGEAELWIFIFADMLLFGLFFAIWGWQHATEPELFAWGAAQMNRTLGLANTLVLITSSAAVAAGLAQARQGRPASRAYLAAAILGAVFVVLKVVEYSGHIAAGADPRTSAYFMYYFVFTGIHLLHVLIGIVALLFVAQRCHRLEPGRAADAADLVLLEGAGVFWHLVDVLWIVLFFAIYLAR